MSGQNQRLSTQLLRFLTDRPAHVAVPPLRHQHHVHVGAKAARRLNKVCVQELLGLLALQGVEGEGRGVGVGVDAQLPLSTPRNAPKASTVVHPLRSRPHPPIHAPPLPQR